MATKAKTEKAAKTTSTGSGQAGDFAIFQTGGKQYMVAAGDKIKIEKIKGDHKVGDTVSFDDVLLVESGSDTTLGAPFIKGAKVSAEITKIARAPKVTVIKYKAKSNYFKKRGHKQPFFEVKISNIK
ncbi:MAG TPA: 50S ribosomal protein L21 [Candidatus Paceibacterota bacterium]|nr:50S ribosomal protein L21 [Candidatus Paceibacterota bacterium]